MKRALLFASCGVVLALIIGATTSSRNNEALEVIPRDFRDQKCLDRSGEVHKPECRLNNFIVPAELHAEIFLRKVKRKARAMYA